MSLTRTTLLVAAAIAFCVVLWNIARKPRKKAPDFAVIEVAPAGAESSPALTAAAEAAGRSLSAGLAALLREEAADAPCEASLFAPLVPPWPPGLARGLARLGAGAAGGEALRRLQDPSVGPRTLAGVIAADPVLTGQVLKIANSPLFGLRTAVSSLAQAIGIMGLTHLRLLLFNELLEGAGARVALAAAVRQALWLHLGTTAVLASHLAPAFSGLDTGTLFTAGMLHDLGRLALYGADDAAFLDDPRAETARFGVNHAVAGCAACRQFDLPRDLQEGVRLHHAPFFVEMEDVGAEIADIRLALALGLADRLAHVLEAGEGDPPAAVMRPVLASYRFLLRPPVLDRCLHDPRLHADLVQSRAMLRLAAT